MKDVARIGTISHGTLGNEDLLEAFASECEALGIAPALVKEANAILEDDDCTGDGIESETVSELIQELSDALNEVAPPYCYFGAHEGDGSDFGFWPCLEQIEELPRITDSDPDLAIALGEDCIYVNDHGNLTVYSGNGRVVLELV